MRQNKMRNIGYNWASKQTGRKLWYTARRPNTTPAHITLNLSTWKEVVPPHLGAETEDGEHGKATVLDLLGLEVLHGGISLAQLEQVEECAACNGQANFQGFPPCIHSCRHNIARTQNCNNS